MYYILHDRQTDLDMVSEAVLRRESLAAAVAEAVKRRVVLAVPLGAEMHLDVAVVGDGLDDDAARLANLD